MDHAGIASRFSYMPTTVLPTLRAARSSTVRALNEARTISVFGAMMSNVETVASTQCQGSPLGKCAAHSSASVGKGASRHAGTSAAGSSASTVNRSARSVNGERIGFQFGLDCRVARRLPRSGIGSVARSRQVREPPKHGSAWLGLPARALRVGRLSARPQLFAEPCSYVLETSSASLSPISACAMHYLNGDGRQDVVTALSPPSAAAQGSTGTCDAACHHPLPFLTIQPFSRPTFRAPTTE